MKKYHVHTTISQKHMDLLSRYKQQFETNQKVIERALECLEMSQARPWSPEEELWMQIGRENKDACLTQKDGLRIMMETTDLIRLQEYVDRQKPIEYAVECFLQKPLRECTLKEVIDGLVINMRICRWIDSISYKDDGAYYTLKITHNMGENASKMCQIFNDSVFYSYGVKTETTISKMTVFTKIYKNL